VNHQHVRHSNAGNTQHNQCDEINRLLVTYLPLITQRVCRHLCGHALLIEDPQLAFIINFYQLLTASGGERDIELVGKRKRELHCVQRFVQFQTVTITLSATNYPKIMRSPSDTSLLLSR